MTREQENAVERLALQRGRLAIREGYADRHIEASAPDGALWLIDDDGRAGRCEKGDWSVDWSCPREEPSAPTEDLYELLGTIGGIEAAFDAARRCAL